ncbi:MAG: T9SS type A sorting domain-containing protein [candidate division Zixibacteria bacterium]|nr:T9SS type A sorting domain-containing protein [candidate division Zixibacteria bacterium]
MNKILILLNIIIITLTVQVSAQDTLWTRTYGTRISEAPVCLQHTPDGGYVMVGCLSHNFDDSIYVVKTNPDGIVQWSHIHGVNYNNRASYIENTYDDGFIVVGGVGHFEGDDFDILLVKLDSVGDTLWTRTFGGDSAEWGECVRQVKDGGYVISGSTNSYGAGSMDWYLIRTDENGDTLWTKTYGGSHIDYAPFLHLTDDGFIMISTTFSYGAGHTDIYVIRTDDFGDTLWTHTYGGIEGDGAHCIIPTNDGNYILAGGTASFGNNGDIFLIKINPDGDVIWQKTYGTDEREGAYSIKQTSDNGFIIVGMTGPLQGYYTDLYVLRTDWRGDSLWACSYGGDYNESGVGVHQDENGDFIISARTSSFGAGSSDFWLLKIHEVMTTVGENSNVIIPQEVELYPNYPNPFNSSTNISFQVLRQTDVNLCVYNILGEQVESETYIQLSPGCYMENWNPGHLATGTYLLRLNTGSNILVDKMMLIK